MRQYADEEIDSATYSQKMMELTTSYQKVIIKYADFFDVSADYILGRTDKPEGKLYNNEPELLRLSVIREGEWSGFIEACFDPRSPMNKKLKDLMLSMSGESILD